MVGRSAGGLTILAALALVVLMVVLVAAGAGNGRDVSETPGGLFALNVLLPIMAASAILGLLLALLNGIGVKPWFDEKTGLYVRPASGSEWAVKLGGLLAGLLIPVTLLVVVIGALILSASGQDINENGGVLGDIIIGGLCGAVGIGGIAGGIVLMGWFGVVAGLMIGAGLAGVVAGPQFGTPAATVLGVISLALAVATFYAGAKFRGTIPATVGSYAASGGYLAIGIGFFITAAFSAHPLNLVVGGFCGVAATVGYWVGALLARRSTSARTSALAVAGRESAPKHLG